MLGEVLSQNTSYSNFYENSEGIHERRYEIKEEADKEDESSVPITPVGRARTK
jgi:hypothetical protein